MKSFLFWLHGLGAALIGGASTAITLAVSDPQTFNFGTGFGPLWHVALVSGLLSAAGYLKQSPLPPAGESVGSIVKLILVFSLLPSLFLVSCSAISRGPDGSLHVNANVVRADVQAAVPYVRPAAAAACTGVITFGVSSTDRADIANDVYAVASVIDALASGDAPTPDQFKAAISVGTGNGDSYVMIAQAIESVYAGVYPQIKGDPKLAIQILGEISAGARDAAAAFTGSK